jgi:hypothetical protein
MGMSGLQNCKQGVYNLSEGSEWADVALDDAANAIAAKWKEIHDFGGLDDDERRIMVRFAELFHMPQHVWGRIEWHYEFDAGDFLFAVPLNDRTRDVTFADVSRVEVLDDEGETIGYVAGDLFRAVQAAPSGCDRLKELASSLLTFHNTGFDSGKEAGAKDLRCKLRSLLDI